MRHVHRGTCWSWSCALCALCACAMCNETCLPWNMLILICAMWCSICPRCNMSFPPWHMQRDILQCDVHCTIWWVYILSALSTMTCAMCNETCPPWNMLILKLCTAPMCTLCKCNVQCAMRHETCPPWKDRSPAINVPPQMHQQQTKGRKYGANVLLGIWQQQRDQVL